MIKRIPVTDEPPKPGEVKRLDGRQVRIESVERESLGAVTQRQLVNEGWKSRSAWRADWVAKNDRKWVAWAGTGTCVSQRCVTDVELCRRFAEHWAEQFCWTVRYTILDAERFLANRRGKATSDYTTSIAKAIDTLPVMDPDPAFIRQVRERDAKIRAERAQTFKQDLAVARANRSAERSRLRMQRFSG